MARRRFVKTLSSLNETIYTVDTPIGARQNNRRLADVELVQFFLKQFFDDPIHKADTPPTRKGIKKILIDGIVGSQTIKAITYFQKYQFNRVIDGIVSVPIINASFVGTRMETMWKLNHWFANNSPLKDSFPNLEKLLVNDNSAPHLLAELVANDLANNFPILSVS